MTDRDVMQQALEALEDHAPLVAKKEIISIRKALAQPAQEPVAWYDKHGMVTHDPFEGVTPLYTADQMREYTKQAVEAEREACAKVVEDAAGTGKIISCTSAAAAIRARSQA